jgi:HNH endonuclease
MNTPSFKFKKMICAHSRDDRDKILYPIKNWLIQQISVDPKASACYSSIQEIYQVNTWADNKSFKEHYMWAIMSNHDSCVSFQEIVKAKGVPIKNIAVAINDANSEPRKAIPKKIRGEAWKIQFGNSIKGFCFCCKKELDVFDDWHAGHIVSHSNNGTDTADNLRPVCGSCNLSMGTENMDAFKARCYPN